MPKTRAEKEEVLTKLEKDLTNAKGVVFTEYKGLTVKDIDKVRRNLRKEKVSFSVIKVTLIKKALEKLNFDLSKFKYSGPVAIALSNEDETTPARIIKGMFKEFPSLVIDGGILNKELIADDVVVRLALLPSMNQLRGQLVSVISGPARGLVTVLSGNARALVNVLNAIKDRKQ